MKRSFRLGVVVDPLSLGGGNPVRNAETPPKPSRPDSWSELEDSNMQFNLMVSMEERPFIQPVDPETPKRPRDRQGRPRNIKENICKFIMVYYDVF